jgi:hypothetical protein
VSETPLVFISSLSPLWNANPYKTIKFGVPSGRVKVGIPNSCKNFIPFIVALSGDSPGKISEKSIASADIFFLGFAEVEFAV